MNVRPCEPSEDKEEIHRSLGLSDKEQYIKEEVPSDSETGRQRNEQHKNRKILSDGGCLDTKNTIPRHLTAPFGDREIKEEVPSASEKGSRRYEPTKKRGIVSGEDGSNSKKSIPRLLTVPIADREIKEEDPSDSVESRNGVKRRKGQDLKPVSKSKRAVSRPLATVAEDPIIKSEGPSDYIKEKEPSDSEERTKNVKKRKCHERSLSRPKIVHPVEDQIVKSKIPTDTEKEAEVAEHRNERSSGSQRVLRPKALIRGPASFSPTPLPAASNTDNNVTDESDTDSSQDMTQNSSNSSSSERNPIRRRMKQQESQELTKEEKEARRKEKNRIHALNYWARKRDQKEQLTEKLSHLQKQSETMEKRNKDQEKNVLAAYARLVTLSSQTDSPYGSFELLEEQLISQKLGVSEEIMEKDDNGRELQKLEEESFAAEDKLKEIVANGFPEGALRATITSKKCRAKGAFELAKLGYETKFAEVENQKKEAFGKVLDEFLLEVNKLLEQFVKKEPVETTVEMELTEQTE